jgi:hypothetical protein
MSGEPTGYKRHVVMSGEPAGNKRHPENLQVTKDICNVRGTYRLQKTFVISGEPAGYKRHL